MRNSLRPTPTALLNPCADPVFKALFTQETPESRRALTSFLSAIFEKPVSDVRLVQNELSVETENEKQSRFDINCLVDGNPVNIEMQGVNHGDSYGLRAEYHAAHLFNHFVKAKEEWQDLPKAFQISVLNFVFEPDEQGVHHYRMQTDDGKRISDRLNIIFVELPKFDESEVSVEKLTPVQRWCKFFLYAARPEKIGYLAKLVAQEEGLMDAQVTLMKLSAEESEWYRQTASFIAECDRLSMIGDATRKGLRAGIEKSRSEIALKMISKGMAEDEISEITGLSIDEIKKLSK